MSVWFLGFALQNTLLASLIGALALLAMRFFPRRPGVAHTLWVLALLKLLTPPFWSVPLWTAPALEAPCPSLCLSGEQPIAGRSAPETAIVFPKAADLQPSPQGWSWADLIVASAFMGTIAYILIMFIRLIHIHRLLRRLPEHDPDGEWPERVAEMGVAPPRVRWSSEPLSPMLLALGTRPTLVLPLPLWESLNAEERRGLVMHELAHLARGDHYIRYLEVVVLALYWWNPLAWFATAQLRRAEELSCDALVIATRPEVAPAYASALIETLAFLAGHPSKLPAEASGAGPVVDIRRRLGMILQNKSPYVGRGGVLMAVVALVVLCPVVPTRAEPKVPDTIEGLIATQKSCQQCHTPAKPGTPALPELHDDVVRLVEELRRARRDLAESEAKLHDVLREFEKKTAPKEEDAEKTHRRLKQQIRELQEQLEELEKQPKVLPGKDSPRGNQPVHYMKSKEFKLPVKIAPEAIGSKLRIFIQKRDSGVWNLLSILQVANTDRHVNVQVVDEGEYHFTVGVAPDFRPQEPGQIVIVDTTPPEVQFSARKPDKDIVLSWTATDAHLSPEPEGIYLEYRDHKGVWRGVGHHILNARDSLRLHPDFLEHNHYRIRVFDKAGNVTVKTATVK
jgi:beta-lactamase regulating signal transducer with metallopeptidase domain